MTQMPHWSATRFTLWEQCPGEFKARYVDGQPFRQTEAMAFGSAVHMGLEAHFRGEDGTRAFRAAWRGLTEELGGYEAVDQKLTGMGLTLMEQVFELNLAGIPERGFELDTEAELDAPIVGAIDLWGADGVIYDFKTTAGLWSQARAQKELWQPVLYTWARWDEEPAYAGDFEYIVLNRNTGTLQRFRREWSPAEVVAQMNEAWDRMRVVAAKVKADEYECRTHGWCPECGDRWSHSHVCYPAPPTQRLRLRASG